MLGDGKKTYIIGRTADIDQYLELNPQWLYNPNDNDQILRVDNWSVDMNRRWIRRAADDVKAGLARILVVSAEGLGGSMTEQELHWFKEFGLEYDRFEGEWLPKGQR